MKIKKDNLIKRNKGVSRSECGKCDGKGCGLGWWGIVTAIFASLIVFGLLMLFSTKSVGAYESCMSREEVGEQVTSGVCLVIYDDKVYDLTGAEKWDITGHVGRHLCGREYDKETIEAGPHSVSVLKRFFKTNLCGTEAVVAVEEPGGERGSLKGWFEDNLGMSLFKMSSYLALLFFILNFLTCYAMPWARVRQPWEGERPGSDEADRMGRFPLTHWHKYFAWLAIASLGLHGLLGFARILWGIYL